MTGYEDFFPYREAVPASGFWPTPAPRPPYRPVPKGPPYRPIIGPPYRPLPMKDDYGYPTDTAS